MAERDQPVGPLCRHDAGDTGGAEHVALFGVAFHHEPQRFGLHDHEAFGDGDPLGTWWGFMVPERSLGGMLYTLFRPNLGVVSVVVQVWDAGAVEPWLAPYARQLWHLPHPTGDLTDCEVGGLRLECLEPLTAYRLRFDDDDLMSLDLEFRGLSAPHEVPVGGGSGHFDQGQYG